MLVRVPGQVVVNRAITIPEAELSWRFSRASGPGGQSVNTTDSRVELSWDLVNSAALGPVQRRRALERLAGRLTDGVLTIAASEHRSQWRNREAALAGWPPWYARLWRRRRGSGGPPRRRVRLEPSVWRRSGGGPRPSGPAPALRGLVIGWWFGRRTRLKNSSSNVGGTLRIWLRMDRTSR